jgi:hypothetical protein
METKSSARTYIARLTRSSAASVLDPGVVGINQDRGFAVLATRADGTREPQVQRLSDAAVYLVYDASPYLTARRLE